MTFCVCRICKKEGLIGSATRNHKTGGVDTFTTIPGFRFWVCSDCHTKLKTYFEGLK